MLAAPCQFPFDSSPALLIQLKFDLTLLLLCGFIRACDPAYVGLLSKQIEVRFLLNFMFVVLSSSIARIVWRSFDVLSIHRASNSKFERKFVLERIRLGDLARCIIHYQITKHADRNSGPSFFQIFPA
jgi:hypothetical protein